MSTRLLAIEQDGVEHHAVDVSTMLDRRLDGAEWYVHHKHKFESYSESGDVRSLEQRVGTFRHNSCLIGYDASELEDSACALCRGIVAHADFHQRARRLVSETRGKSMNDQFMSRDELVAKVSELEARQSKARRERTWHIFKICALTSRVKTLREKAAESCARGDVRRLIDDLKYCAAQGKVERKQVLFNFISDAVRSVRFVSLYIIQKPPLSLHTDDINHARRQTNPAAARSCARTHALAVSHPSWSQQSAVSPRSRRTRRESRARSLATRQYRRHVNVLILNSERPISAPSALQVRLDGSMSHYHESTHRMYEMLKHYGGPRSHRFIEANLAGPHLRTTEKRWARLLHHYELGFDEKSFVFLARFYKVVLEKLEIPLGCVPCECSEDESACQDEPRWNQRRDQLVGF